MPRVAALHLLAHLRVGAVPEAAQVAGDLQRLAAGGQQVQGQRHPAVGDGRGVGQAEQFLQLHRQHRRLRRAFVVQGVVDAPLHPRGHGDACRRQALDLLAQLPGQGGFQRLAQFRFRQRIEPGLAGEGRLQPVVHGRQQGGVGQVGQAQLRHPLPQRDFPCLPLAQAFAPRQCLQPQLAHRLGQGLRGLGRVDPAGRPAVEHDAVEARLAPCHQGALAGIPDRRFALEEAFGEIGTQACLVHWCSAQQQRIPARLVAQFAGHQPGLAAQGAVFEQARAAAVGQLVAQRVGRMPGRDPVGKGVGEQVAQFVRLDVRRRRGLAAQAPAPLPGRRVDRRQRRTAGVGRHAATAEGGQRTPAFGQRVAAAAQRIAGLDQRGQVGRQRLLPWGTRRQQHRRQPRMGAQGEHAPALGGGAAAGGQCPKPLQQFARGGQRPGRRRIDEAQALAAPGRQFQRQPGQFDLGDLRPALRLQPLRLRPQPPGPAFGHAPGTAGALVGRSLGDGHHVQPRETAVGIEARLARQAAVDHHAHAGQGDRGFGDIGRQHHPATAIGRWLQHPRLLLHRQFAVQGQHLGIGRQRGRFQRRLHPRDLALAGQEHQHIARMPGQRLLGGPPRLGLQ